MDDMQLRDLVEEHARFPEALAALCAGRSAAALRAREREGKWSPLEILAHLLDEETLDFGARARAAVAGEPVRTEIDPEGWVVAKAYNAMDPVVVLADFARARAASCRWLATLAATDLERALEHPRLGRMRAGDFIAAWRVHDLLHLRQLAAALAVNRARDLAGWRVEYAGRLPVGA